MKLPYSEAKADLTIQRWARGYAVYRGSERLTGIIHDLSYAETRREKLAQLEQARTRPCMCCGTGFRSQGAHNRLCDPCRQLDLGIAS